MNNKRFPIMGIKGGSVSWDLIAPFEHRAIKNHYQTLERLAERGGLGVKEFWAVLHDVPWEEASKISDEEALSFLYKAISDFDHNEIRREREEAKKEVADLEVDSSEKINSSKFSKS